MRNPMSLIPTMNRFAAQCFRLRIAVAVSLVCLSVGILGLQAAVAADLFYAFPKQAAHGSAYLADPDRTPRPQRPRNEPLQKQQIAGLIDSTRLWCESQRRRGQSVKNLQKECMKLSRDDVTRTVRTAEYL